MGRGCLGVLAVGFVRFLLYLFVLVFCSLLFRDFPMGVLTFTCNVFMGFELYANVFNAEFSCTHVAGGFIYRFILLFLYGF